MTTRLIAHAAGIDEDPETEVLTVAIGEAEDGSGWVLLFMCFLYEPDAQEVALGHDTYCLVTADQETLYGGVREVTLQNHVLRVVMSPENLEPLGLDAPDLEVTLNVAVASIDQLRKGLRRVLTYGRPDEHPTLLDL